MSAYPSCRRPTPTATINSRVSNKFVVGIAVLDSRLFVAREDSQDLESYDVRSPDHSITSVLRIPEVQMIFNMASCDRKHCLYLSDFGRTASGCVWSVRPPLDVETAVTTSTPPNVDLPRLVHAESFIADIGRPYGITVDVQDDRVLVVCEEPNSLRVHSSDGTSIVTVRLSEDELEAPRQAIQFSTGLYAIIHGWLGRWNRLCLIDTSGNVLRTYGTTSGFAPTQIHWPAALIVDGLGRMLIGDRENNRVHLVGRDFKLVRHIVTGSDGIARPRRLALHPVDGTLYVGQVSPEVKAFQIADTSNQQTDLNLQRNEG